MTQEQMNAEIQRQAALIVAQQQQQAAANAAQHVQTTVAPVASVDTSISDLGKDEQDALLAELNAIGN
jgi:hypothetical protein